MGFEDIFTIVVVLAMVAGVIYLSYWFSRSLSRGAVKINHAKYLSVVDRLVVGQDRYIVIIKVLSQYYLASITGQSIVILKELDGEEIAQNEAQQLEKPQGIDTFKNVLSGMLNKKDKDKEK